ncbi:MAG: GAF domain-containing protein [Christensenellales bacterium]
MKRCRISTGRASTLPAAICCILAHFRQDGSHADSVRPRRMRHKAAATRQVQVVPDVERFPGHIACDSASRSEIVLPIWVDGRLLGVLDIDSPSLNRFTEEDADGLTAFVASLTRSVDFAHGLLK